MSNISKAIAVLGVVAGLGVAALPLSSYAATSRDVKVTAKVDNTISVSADTTEVNLGTISANGAPSVGSVNVNVTTSNASGYKLSVASTNKDAALYSVNESGVIDTTASKAITSSSAVKQGSTAWGVKGGDLLNWTKVAASTDATPTLIRTTAAPAATGEPTKVEFGVSVGENFAEGTYEGYVVFTAETNA